MRTFFFILFAFPFFAAGCNDNDEVLPEQQTKFASYLSSTHEPRLISETEKEESLDENPEFYTMTGNTVYRYIRNFYDPGRSFYPMVQYGDRVWLSLSMYQFDYKNLDFIPQLTTGAGGAVTVTMSLPYYSNNPEIVNYMRLAGLTEGSWPTEPQDVMLGETPLLKGLELALPGVRERDTLEVYMTYNMAYGDKPTGVILKETPIAVLVKVEQVDKGGVPSGSDQTLRDQQARFASYFYSTHVPGLLSEQQLAASTAREPKFYETTGNSAYRYIWNYYEEERQSRPEVAEGDVVKLTFSMYRFGFGNLTYLPDPDVAEEKQTVSKPFYSNNAALEDLFRRMNLPADSWTFEPLEVKLGETEILKGIESALPGLRERDTVEVYMTYNMAYGDESYPDFPAQSPVAVFLTVDEVTKN